MESTMTLAQDLAQDMKRRLGGCVCRARINYFFAYLLLTVAVTASAASAIAIADAAIDWSREAKAVLAALSGIIVLALSTFRFEARAEWWFTMHHGLDALYRGLTYEGMEVAVASRALTTLIAELEKKWPGFGKPPSGTGT